MNWREFFSRLFGQKSEAESAPGEYKIESIEPLSVGRYRISEVLYPKTFAPFPIAV